MKYLLNLIGNKKTSTIAYSDFIKYCINNQLKSQLIDCENNSVKDIIYSHRNTHLLLNLVINLYLKNYTILIEKFILVLLE